MAHGITTAMIPARAFRLLALLARIACTWMAKPTWPGVPREKDTDRVKGIRFVRVIRYLQTSEAPRRTDGNRPDIHITEAEFCISAKTIGAISLAFSCSVQTYSWGVLPLATFILQKRCRLPVELFKTCPTTHIHSERVLQTRFGPSHCKRPDV